MEIDIENAKRDPAAREAFIREHETFILQSAGKVCHKLVTKSDDAWSVALSAFNEAIDSFRPDQGNFQSFAFLVIQRRLTDHIRKLGKIDENEVPVEPYAFDGTIDEDPTALQAAVNEEAGRQAESRDIRPAAEEIAAMQEILKQYGFSFFDLAAVSPKAGKTKKYCALAAGAVLAHPELLDSMRKSHTLPASGILKAEKVPPKILERHRRYIIAVVEILEGDFPILGSYLQGLRKEMKQ